MVSVIGRRRVGKTYLIKTTYQDYIDFEITGIENAPRSEQLYNFAYQLTRVNQSSIPLKIPENWLEAFIFLTRYLEKKKKKNKMVVFLDELSWMDTHKSGFLRGLSFFWNSWAVNQHIVVVICSSAASWMIKKVVNHKGGLHNRITKRIHIKPFTLAETKRFFQQRHFNFNHYQIIELYMAMGGIPHYLKEVKRGKSATQNIEKICFSEQGLLKTEFNNLYTALFSDAENHISIIKALAGKHQGLSLQKLAELSSIAVGGTLKKVLEELEQSGFIGSYRPFGKKKKGKLYRLTDEYSLFYLQFIQNKAYEGQDIWHHLSQTQAYKSWSGYAFENICLKHIPQIKKALGVSGIFSLSSSYFQKGTATQEGVQIDLLIDRKDQVINLFEIKFYNETFILTKSYAQQLIKKRRIFRTKTQTKKQLFWVLLTTYGVEANQHSIGLVDQVLTMDDLFID